MKRHLVRFLFLSLFFFVSTVCFGYKTNRIETLYLDDYIVIQKQSTLLIINQKSLETTKVSNISIPNLHRCKPIGNSIFLPSKRKISIEYYVNQLDKNIGCLVFFFVTLLGFGLLVFAFRKTKHSDTFSTKIEVVEKHSFYDRIYTYQGKTLQASELDVLFDIQKLSYDSRKLKRHRLIQEINKLHPGLIQRIKDKEDQRKYLYFICKTQD